MHFYTIGQRKGLKIADGPWFVKDVDIDKNVLIVSKKPEEITKKRVVLSIRNKLKLVFDKPQRAVTSGQFAVFYLPAGVCLGGGRIL